MSKRLHFCTIITPNYIDYVKVQYELIKKFNENVEIHVLVSTTDTNDVKTETYRNLPASIKCYTANDICADGIGKEIFDKYFSTYTDGFRWSMKPVFMNFLLKKGIANKLICMDWDIVFFNDYNFLFDDLDNYDVLLTPNWFTLSPFELTDRRDQKAFECYFKQGLFQAGFVAANKNGGDLLDWWSKICLFVCEFNLEKGYFVDQTHLNLFPLLSKNVGIVQHRGCNVAEWNKVECKRVKIDDNTLINGKYPIVFVHVTGQTVENVLDGRDPLVLPYFNAYAQSYFEITGQRLPVLINYENRQKLKNRELAFFEKVKKLAVVYKNKVRIKTRFRRFFEGQPYN